jgi:hypothetical protein
MVIYKLTGVMLCDSDLPAALGGAWKPRVSYHSFVSNTTQTVLHVNNNNINGLNINEPLIGDVRLFAKNLFNFQRATLGIYHAVLFI